MLHPVPALMSPKSVSMVIALILVGGVMVASLRKPTDPSPESEQAPEQVEEPKKPDPVSYADPTQEFEERTAQVKQGMSEKEVLSQLGPPQRRWVPRKTTTFDLGLIYPMSSSPDSILVSLKRGKVVSVGTYHAP